MPVVLVKIPATQDGRRPVHLHSTESDRKDIISSSPAVAAVVVPDAVDQLDATTSTTIPTTMMTTKNRGEQEQQHDKDFEVFQNQAQTWTMTEGDGTTVVATTIPSEEEEEEGETDDTVVKEIVVEAGDSVATALLENTIQHSESLHSLSIRKLVDELKDAKGSYVVASHPTTALEEKLLLKGRFVSPNDFDLLKVIGMGAFGKVLQVKSKVTGQILAMKVISKRKLKSKHGYIENVKAERDILTRVKHPFVVAMHCSFQTREKLFILMDFLAGGELFLRIGREGIFLEKTASFYLAEIVLALDHLHSLGIIHRDLKPENVLLGSDGHIVLTDFGLAKDFGQDGFHDEDARALTVCGTQEYMAPEMIARKGYGRAADYWSLGCIAYEMLNGLPPFIRKKNEGSKDLFRKIMTEKVKMPSGASADACKLLKGLLNRNVENRLGTTRNKMFVVGGVAAIKSLPFFNDIEWEKLDKKQVEPPEMLPVEDDHDLKHFHDDFVNMALPRSVIEMSKDGYTPRRVQSMNFRGFSFIQPGFALPERDDKEVEAYWNAADEDGESISDVASSKCANEDTPPLVEEKKKRPPRKRKKKKPVDIGATTSAQTTPAPSVTASAPPSEAGDEANEESPQDAGVPATNTDATKQIPEHVVVATAPVSGTPEIKDSSQETQCSSTSLNPGSQTWTPQSVSRMPIMAASAVSNGSMAAKTTTPAPKQKVDEWQSVGSIPAAGVNNKSRNLPTAKPQNGQTPTSRTGNVWNTVSTAPKRGVQGTPNRPQNGWNSGPPATRTGNFPQSQQDRMPQVSNGPWGLKSPPPPPLQPSSNRFDGSSSSDWRHHTMSPRTPGGGNGRSIRKTPTEQTPQQFWPSLNDPALPSKPSNKPKLSGGVKLKGAWANRK